MYTLIRHLRLRDALLSEAPGLLLSFGIAELFYKFHSFTLECACFLATWLVISTVLGLLTRRPVRACEANG